MRIEGGSSGEERTKPLKRELPTGDVIRVTGPIKLEPGQNFYDQFPFKDAIAQVADQTGIQQGDLCHLLTSYIKKLEDPKLSESRREGLQNMRLDTVKELLPYEKSRGKGEKYKPGNLRVSLKSIINALDQAEYPGWKEYINFKLDPTNYKFNGEYSSRAQKPVSEPTYMTWVENRITTGKKMQAAKVTLAMGETFPQQDEGITPDKERDIIQKTWEIKRTRGLGH